MFVKCCTVGNRSIVLLVFSHSTMTSCFFGVESFLRVCCSMQTLDLLARTFCLQPEQISTTETLFKDCKEVARNLCRQCEHVKFNKSLCTLLATTYSRSLDSVLPLSGPVYETVVTEMRRVMLCGETLVAQCKDENWWRSVISSSDSAAIEKRILLHLKEFRLCVNMLRLIANSGVPPDGTFLRPVVLDPSTLDVEEACRKDIESLFSAIEGYKRTSYAKGDVTKLAEYVLNKVRAANSDHSHLQLMEYDDVKLGDFLGNGSFGSVFKCQFLGVKAAAKVFTASSSSVIKAVENEANLQARLRHPNVVQFIGYAVKGSQHIIVTELMTMDLRRYLDENLRGQTQPPLPLLLAVDIMLQMAEAMRYLHQSGVMHRDLKANNVLINVVESKKSGISPSVQVKVTDFGFSKLNLDNSRFTSKQIGATRWRAPEAFEDEQNTEKYTKRADVYSFAITFFEVLTGEMPFANIPLTKLLSRIRCNERPTLPAEDYCPAHLSTIIEKCWATRAKDRPKFPEICLMLVKVKERIIINSCPIPSAQSSTPQKCNSDGH